jgi:hypothetical protein
MKKSFSEIPDPDQTMEEMIDRLLRETEKRQNRIRKQDMQQLSEQFESLRNDLKPVFDAIDKIPQLESNIQKVLLQVNRVNRSERKNNIIVYGLFEKDGETFKDRDFEVDKLAKTLKIGSMDYSESFRLGKQQKGKSRPMLIKMVRFRDKAEILSKWKLLQGTGVSIKDDLSVEERKVRGILSARCREIQQGDKSAKCQIRNGMMTVTTNRGEERFMVNEETFTIERATSN